jgi:hypothetical protein
MSTGSERASGESARGRKVLFGAMLAIGFAAAAILFFFDPTRVPIYPVCLFHQMTGLDCPGCGGLRATHALLHGDVSSALHFNAMVVLSALLLVVVSCWMLFQRIRNKPIQVRWNLLWVYFAVWMTFSVLRVLPIPYFAAFAP